MNNTMLTEVPTLLSSRAEVWYLKQIRFGGRSLQIITQNFNGPCSFIAICNILILRGNIEILPLTRTTVSYEFLSQLVAEYLLTSSPDVDVSAALSIMPLTQKGMDLNPLFTASTSFRPGTTTAGGELKLFEQVGIKLVHGWLVDPDSAEAHALVLTPDYDSAVTLIADADHITHGQLVVGQYADGNAGQSQHSPEDWTHEERAKIENAIIVQRFLENTQSQLTYHGLFHLATTLPPGSLVALFRSSHLSVLYKFDPNSQSLPTLSSPPLSSPSNSTPPNSSQSQSNPSLSSVIQHSTKESPDPPQRPSPSQHSSHPSHAHSSIYTLVTDQVFLHEPSVVWERVEDVDGGSSTFVDSDFVRSSPAGGDWAGRTAEEAVREQEGNPTDRELAQQLQAEEEHYARMERDAYEKEQERRQQQQQQQQQRLINEKKEKERKKKADCVIM